MLSLWGMKLIVDDEKSYGDIGNTQRPSSHPDIRVLSLQQAAIWKTM